MISCGERCVFFGINEGASIYGSIEDSSRKHICFSRFRIDGEDIGGKLVLGTLLYVLILISLSISAFNVQPARAWTGGTITINFGGSDGPPGAPVQRNATTNIYTLTDDVNVGDNDGVYVNRADAVLDGAGRTLRGDVTLA